MLMHCVIALRCWTTEYQIAFKFESAWIARMRIHLQKGLPPVLWLCKWCRGTNSNTGTTAPSIAAASSIVQQMSLLRNGWPLFLTLVQLKTYTTSTIWAWINPSCLLPKFHWFEGLQGFVELSWTCWWALQFSVQLSADLLNWKCGIFILYMEFNPKISSARSLLTPGPWPFWEPAEWKDFLIR